MPRQRKSSELRPIPAELQPLFDNGLLLDYRLQTPVHSRYGERGFRWGDERPLDALCATCAHHSAGSNDDVRFTAEGHCKPGDRLTSDGRGAPGLAYTLAIPRADTGPLALYCNDIAEPTWSQGVGGTAFPQDENRHLVGVLMLALDDPTESQLRRFWLLQAELERALEWPYGSVTGHFDFGKAACPGPTPKQQIMATRGQDLLPFSTVESWQQALVKLGYDLGSYGPERDGVDGVFGAACRRALRAFQGRAFLRRTETRDLLTALMLRKATATARLAAFHQSLNGLA